MKVIFTRKMYEREREEDYFSSSKTTTYILYNTILTLFGLVLYIFTKRSLDIFKRHIDHTTSDASLQGLVTFITCM